MNRPRHAAGVVAVLLLATAAFTPRPQPPLTVFAAASLTDAFQELGDTLRRREPGLRVVFNFAGSTLTVRGFRIPPTGELCTNTWARSSFTSQA